MLSPDYPISGNPGFTREILAHRHRLSGRQIDDFLGESNPSPDPYDLLTSLAHVSEFLKITDALRKAAIPFISFKGPLLSQKIYGDATCRISKDFDLLIDPHFLPAAIDLFKAERFLIGNSDFPKDPCKLNLILDHNNQIECYHPSRQSSVEIHVRLFKLALVSKSRMQDLVRANTIKINFHGREFTVFNHEFDLVYLIIHGGLHYWRRLKWLVDIKDAIANIPLDEKRFLELTTLFHAQGMVALCNALLEVYFPTSGRLPQTTTVSPKLLKNSISEIESRHDIHVIDNTFKFFQYSIKRSNSFPHLRYKISALQLFLFASDLCAKPWMPCSSILNYLLGPFWKLYRGIRYLN